MSQAMATKLISKLRYNIRDRRRLRNPQGPLGRHNKIKKTVTALLKHERIELNFNRADESRGYAERLISDAIRYGELHKPTMEMASYWIIEPQIVQKLFKVLVPRYKTLTKSYTKMWRAPKIYPGYGRDKCVLELRNNIYPSLEPDLSHNKNLIHNVLLEEARKAYEKRKAQEAEAAAGTKQGENSGMEASQKANIQSVVDGGVNSDTVETAVNETELSSEENLKAVGEGESEVKTESDSATEVDIDLSKMKIADEKPNEKSQEDEKK